MIRHRIPTRSHPIRRAAASFWQAMDDHQWLPLAIAFALLLIVNSPLFN